jgi:prolipoprotein diacylglyceryl transferase
MEHFVWNIDPTLLHLGPLQLRWYGLLFVGSFFLGAMILNWIYKREGKDPEVVETLLIYLMVGAVIGSRLVHCFFYEPDFYLSNPLEILYVWKGGLASHGGLLGVFISMYVFSRVHKESYMWIVSRVAIPGALTAAFVRFGNFFNSEILGKPSDAPWAIVFERIDLIPRHPVQLYEAFAYLTILALLVLLYRKVTPAFATKILPGVFLVLLFTARFFIEYAKTRQAAYITELPFSTGQMLSVPYIIIGILWIIWAINARNKTKL